MDIAQLIDVADPARAGRVQGTVADGDGGDDFAFARSYDLSPGGEAPPDKPDPAELTALAPADPALFGLIVALPVKPETDQPLPEVQASLAPVAADWVSTGSLQVGVLAQPVITDGWSGALMAATGEAPGGPGDGVGLAATPEDDRTPALYSGPRVEMPGSAASGLAAGIVAERSGETRPDLPPRSGTPAPDAVAATAAGRIGVDASPVATTATATTIAANPAVTAALPAGRPPDAASDLGQSSDGGSDNGPPAAADSREARPKAEDRPLAAPGRHGAAEGGADGGGGEKGMGEWAATVAPGRGAEDLSGARPADLSVHGRGHPLIAQDIGRQLADAMTAMPDRPVEIALSPEELGRVRMVITTTDGTVSLQVVAERPETVELMRRHADLLAQDLRQLGFDQLDFRFSGQSDGRAGQGPASQPDQTAAFRGKNDSSALAPPDPASERSVSPARASGRSLDIRL